MRRLEQILELLPSKHRLVDVGTDHAKLPILAIQSSKFECAIASDLRSKPLQKASENVLRAGLSEKIEILHTAGLTDIDLRDDDLVTICGMGGYEIKNILEEHIAQIPRGTEFVLQPNWTYGVLRNFLTERGFTYLDEWVVEERKHIYILLHVRYDAENYTLEPLVNFIGPKIMSDVHLQLETHALPEIRFKQIRNYLVKMQQLASKKGRGDAISAKIARQIQEIIDVWR